MSSEVRQLKDKIVHMKEKIKHERERNENSTEFTQQRAVNDERMYRQSGNSLKLEIQALKQDVEKIQQLRRLSIPPSYSAQWTRNHTEQHLAPRYLSRLLPLLMASPLPTR